MHRSMLHQHAAGIRTTQSYEEVALLLMPCCARAGLQQTCMREHASTYVLKNKMYMQGAYQIIDPMYLLASSTDCGAGIDGCGFCGTFRAIFDPQTLYIELQACNRSRQDSNAFAEARRSLATLKPLVHFTSMPVECSCGGASPYQSQLMRVLSTCCVLPQFKFLDKGRAPLYS